LHAQSGKRHIYFLIVTGVSTIFFADFCQLSQIFTGKNSDFRYGVQVFPPGCLRAIHGLCRTEDDVPDCILMQPGFYAFSVDRAVAVRSAA
jgi:hypothetical protein